MFKRKSLSLVTFALLGAGTLAVSGCSGGGSSNSGSALMVGAQVDLSVPAQSVANQEVDFLAEIQNQGMSALGAAMTNNSADTITIDSVTYPAPTGGITIDPLVIGDLPTGETLCYDFNSNTGATLAPSQSCYFGFKAQGDEGDTLTGDVVVNVSGGITQTYTIPVNTTFVGQNNPSLPTAQIGTVNIAPDYTTVITVNNTGSEDLINVVLTLPQWLLDVIDTEQAKTLRIASIKAGESADFSFTLTGQDAIDALSSPSRLGGLNNNPSSQFISITAANLQGGIHYPVVNATLTPIFATDVYFTQPSTQDITITNYSDVDMAYQGNDSNLPTGVTITNDGCAGQTLQTEQSCTIQVAASVQATDIQPQTITFGFQDTNLTAYNVSSQIQVAPVSVTMTVPASIDKPKIGDNPNTATITVTNNGNFDLVAADMSISQAVAINRPVTGVSIVGSDCDSSLAPNASCDFQLEVTDQATVSGENPVVLDATQLANYIGANITHSFTIVGQAGHISIEQGGQGISDIAIQADPSSEETITIRNTGHDNLELGVISAAWQSGSSGALPTIHVNLCSGQPIGSGGSCTFILRGTVDENITEPQSATLTITSTNGEPLSSSIDVVVEPAPKSTQLAQTGQTPTAPIDPAPTGSDGAVQAGVAWDIDSRFVDNENGIVTDTLTGLQWQQDPSINGGTVDWDTALTTCNNATTGGQTDWRLPNVLELSSLVDLAAANPNTALNNNGFDDVQASGYWTSSSFAQFTDAASVVYFFDGSVSVVDKTDVDDFRAWCVRGETAGSNAPLWQTGQTPTAPIDPAPAGSDGAVQAGVAWDITTRFEAEGDVVTDTLTGLMWQQDPSVNNSGNTLDWNSALTTCNDYTVTIDGTEYDDWRLPNRTELYSLVDWANTTNPATALNGNGFANVQASGYWISSSFAQNANYAWIVDFSYGIVFNDFKTGGNYNRAWCVRGGL